MPRLLSGGCLDGILNTSVMMNRLAMVASGVAVLLSCGVLRAELRAVTPMLLQTNMRDTGEILTDISMPIFVDSKHWGALILGIKPEVLIID